MPKVFLSVINDLHSDQRVHRTCMVWQEMGYEVVLSGRNYPNPAPLARPYRTERFTCFFHRGPLFYLEFQWRLWEILRREKPDVYLANDLDTLWPNAYWARRRGKPLVYDSHEYFLGAPELESRPFIQSLWRWVERRYVPQITAGVTVNASIAQAYYAEYGQSMDIVRNVPLLPQDGLPFPPAGDDQQESRRLAACKALDLPTDRPLWILQGAGINIDRGAEELLEAVGLHPNALLLVVGSGDAFPHLQRTAEAQGWMGSKVRFIGRVPREALARYTEAAHLGFSLDKPKSQNYRWSLPNKLFDYFQAGIPVIASNLVEVAAHLGAAGRVIHETTPEAILSAVNELLQPEVYRHAVQAAQQAAHRYHWDHEKDSWKRLIRRLQGETYPRNRWAILSRSRPYIVGSRSTRVLRAALATANGKHLVQGTHLTGLNFPADAILRWHNPEATYYRSLGAYATGLKRAYLRWEAAKLLRWERDLAKRWQGPVWALTAGDAQAWQALGGHTAKIVPPQKRFPGTPPEHGAMRKSLVVPGKFSVVENERAARWTAALPVEVLWAGHDFSDELRRIAGAKGVQILDQPDDVAMARAFHDAAMVLVHAEHSLGLKLKLIQAFYQARWIVAHEAAVQGLDWTPDMGIFTYHSPESLSEAVNQALNTPWDAQRAQAVRAARSPWTQPSSIATLLD
ncbi:MAG: glycosyltransferase [Flavobacteriia bacterium]|nr:glycosyltransferase [Flavobacteriia bacterium]